jgi:hypothetical protein
MTGREWGVLFFIHPSSIHPFIHLFSPLSSLGRCWWWTWRSWHLLEKKRRWRRKPRMRSVLGITLILLLAWPLLHQYYISQLKLQGSPCLLMHCNFFCITSIVATPLWGKCEVATHILENGTWKSFGTPENLKSYCKGQNTLHWGVFYIVGNILKCRCPKWPRMNHLDICSTSYNWKKGRESNWQFDSQPLKVENRPDPSVCMWSATHHWKALKESYKFASDLVPIRGLNKKLWTPKVPKVQTGIISGLHFGSLGKKCHSNTSATEKQRKYYMGEGGGFPRVRAVVSQMNLESPVACSSTKGVPKCELTNLLVGWMQVRVSE